MLGVACQRIRSALRRSIRAAAGLRPRTRATVSVRTPSPSRSRTASFPDEVGPGARAIPDSTRTICGSPSRPECPGNGSRGSFESGDRSAQGNAQERCGRLRSRSARTRFRISLSTILPNHPRNPSTSSDRRSVIEPQTHRRASWKISSPSRSERRHLDRAIRESWAQCRSRSSPRAAESPRRAFFRRWGASTDDPGMGFTSGWRRPRGRLLARTIRVTLAGQVPRRFFRRSLRRSPGRPER